MHVYVCMVLVAPRENYKVDVLWAYIHIQREKVLREFRIVIPLIFVAYPPLPVCSR